MGWSDPGYRWPSETLNISWDHYLVEECEEILSNIDEEWELVHPIFTSFLDFFTPQEFYNKEKFNEVYDQLTTWVFEFNQGDCCIIPFIDFFNHSDKGVYDIVLIKERDDTI